MGINVVVVHGGGKAISRAMAESGLEPEFKNGMRVTDEKTVKIVEKVLNEDVNREICQMLAAQGCDAVLVRGNDVFKCKKHSPVDENGNLLDIGYVGEVDGVDTAAIEKLWRRAKPP